MKKARTKNIKAEKSGNNIQYNKIMMIKNLLGIKGEEKEKKLKKRKKKKRKK